MQATSQRKLPVLKAVITDHHYTDIGNALRTLTDAGIAYEVGDCRDEDAAIALGGDADTFCRRR